MAEKKIGDHTYKCEPVGAKEALSLLTDLMRIGSKSAGRLPALIMAHSEGGNDVMADAAALVAIGDMLDSTPTADVIELVERVLGLAMVMQPSKTYRALDLDGDFTRNLKSLIPVIRWILAVQYADFFTGSAGNGFLNLVRGNSHPKK